LTIRIVLAVWEVFDTIECLLLDESLELKSSLRGFILCCIVISVEFGGFGPILAPQFELKIFPCLILANFVILRMKKFEVSRPPTRIFTIVSIFILYLMETKTIFGSLRPLAKIQ
jgi:hypothetical protein